MACSSITSGKGVVDAEVGFGNLLINSQPVCSRLALDQPPGTAVDRVGDRSVGH